MPIFSAPTSALKWSMWSIRPSSVWSAGLTESGRQQAPIMPPLAQIARTVSSLVLRSLGTRCQALEWVQTGARASGTASARERWPACDRSRIIGVSFTAAISSSPRKLSPASRFSPQPSAKRVAPV